MKRCAAGAGQTRHVQGEGLVQAMRTVPAEYFTEDFSLSRQGAAVACSGQLISGTCIAICTHLFAAGLRCSLKCLGCRLDTWHDVCPDDSDSARQTAMDELAQHVVSTPAVLNAARPWPNAFKVVAQSTKCSGREGPACLHGGFDQLPATLGPHPSMARL